MPTKPIQCALPVHTGNDSPITGMFTLLAGRRNCEAVQPGAVIEHDELPGRTAIVAGFATGGEGCRWQFHVSELLRTGTAGPFIMVKLAHQKGEQAVPADELRDEFIVGSRSAGRDHMAHFGGHRNAEGTGKVVDAGALVQTGRNTFFRIVKHGEHLRGVRVKSIAATAKAFRNEPGFTAETEQRAAAANAAAEKARAEAAEVKRFIAERRAARQEAAV